MSRTENSIKIAQYLKTHSDWEKISNAKPGSRKLDAILLHFFFSKNRLLTPTSYQHNSLGTVDKRSKAIIDFIPKTDKIELAYSAKGFAVFSYEGVLDALFDITHQIDFATVTEADMDFRPANRHFFKAMEAKEDFDEFEMEYE